jgi:hypothetical protein
MSIQRRRQSHLRLVKPDYVHESVTMLRRLPKQSLLCYLLIITHRHDQMGKLSPFRRAYIVHLVGRMVEGIDRAA